MRFKGNVIVTDPCYIIKDSDKINDWDKCQYGENMSKLGFNVYICKNTIYGDWECSVFLINNENPKEFIDNIAKNRDIEELENIQYHHKRIGQFCADSGMVGVFLLDEINEYNPEFLDYLSKHPQIATVLKDFNGDIQYYVDPNNEAHILGNGNINFASLRTGL